MRNVESPPGRRDVPESYKEAFRRAVALKIATGRVDTIFKGQYRRSAGRANDACSQTSWSDVRA